MKTQYMSYIYNDWNIIKSSFYIVFIVLSNYYDKNAHLQPIHIYF